MQCEDLHSGARSVSTLDVPTPLIVPSFSSRGFSGIDSIFTEMVDKLYGVCLVSAWDLAKGHVPTEALLATNVVVLDSGGYEAKGELVEESPSIQTVFREGWSAVEYRRTLDDIDDGANVLVVNYDRETSVHQQIEGALLDRACVPDQAFDFLVKPESTDEPVNIPRLAAVASQLVDFDVVGVTAREIGHSLIARCRAIIMLRNILSDSGLNLPIHVFGAISPTEVLTYFFCGADIFDGLGWLRSAYRNERTIPMDEAVFEDMKWNLQDDELRINEVTNNLTVLYRLQWSMRAYAERRSLQELSRDFPIARKAAHIAELAGAQVL